jgi:hypothetical protein
MTFPAVGNFPDWTGLNRIMARFQEGKDLRAPEGERKWK